MPDFIKSGSDYIKNQVNLAMFSNILRFSTGFPVLSGLISRLLFQIQRQKNKIFALNKVRSDRPNHHIKQSKHITLLVLVHHEAILHLHPRGPPHSFTASGKYLLWRGAVLPRLRCRRPLRREVATFVIALFRLHATPILDRRPTNRDDGIARRRGHRGRGGG